MTPTNQADANKTEVARPALIATVTTTTALALTACGSGDQSGTSSPTGTTPTETTAAASLSFSAAERRASRFLGHATNGPNRTDIDTLVSIGSEAWLDLQFATPRPMSNWEWLTQMGYDSDKYITDYNLSDYSSWMMAISANDTLRQKITLILLDIFVVGQESIQGNWRSFSMAAYLDVLSDNAFGNFRTLLSAITYNPAMGAFLTYLSSSKPSTSYAHPDENYARELMQLFTIGLFLINQDGSLQTDTSGSTINSFTEDDVQELSKAFTGLRYSTSDRTTPLYLKYPLSIVDSANSKEDINIFGRTVTGGGIQAIEKCLDLIFLHQNTAPFFSKRLIQGLVTSNPTPEYIERVANVFDDDGTGARGNLQATIRAVLTDSEAISDSTLETPSFGRLRSPVQRLLNWARGFNAESPSGYWQIGNLSNVSKYLGQSIGRSPSVFNFFSPNFTPPNTEISNNGLLAPEFEMVDDTTSLSYINFIANAIDAGVEGSDVAANYGTILSKAENPIELIDEVQLLLAAGQLSNETREKILNSVNNVSTSDANYKENRSKLAIFLTIISPEYLNQR